MNPIDAIPNDDPMVQQSIQYVLDTGKQRGVELLYDQYVDTSYGITFSGWYTYLTVFFRTGFPDYVVVSGWLAYYPNVSITEMEATGLMPKA